MIIIGSNMKQFSLEEYLKNPKRKIVTRDGRSARIICTDYKDNDFPIIAIVTQDDNHESIDIFDENGVFIFNEESERNLFFAPEKHDGWVIMRDNNQLSAGIYDTYEEAICVWENHFNKDMTKVVKVIWEE